ncbi:MAG: ribosome silencing factor [Flavipsychrobacter sp.]
MDKIINALQGRKKTNNRLTRDSELFTTIIEAIKDKKGENIVSLDLVNITEAVSDFFILCEGQSKTQVKAIAESIEDAVRENCNEKPYHIEKGEEWTLVDYVNVVVHVFQKEHRKFYDLESLWADAEKMEHNDN